MKKKEIVPIVFSVDDNYVFPLSVAIYSVKKHLKGNKLIYVFYDKLSDDSKQKIINLSDEKTEIKLLCVSEEVKGNSFYTIYHFSVAMYYRFFIPILLKEYEKVLYLDCDIMAKRQISSLLNLDVGDYVIAGVRDFGLDDEKYINSGVLLFNVKKCNEFNFTQKCLQYVAKNRDLSLPDQDTINSVCKERILMLESKYNFQVASLFLKMKTIPNVNVNLEAKKLGAKIKDIIFIHYVSGEKPWNYYDLPFSKIWWKYALSLPKEYTSGKTVYYHKVEFIIKIKRLLKRILKR